MTTLVESPSYLVQHVLQINNVEKKKRETSTVTSTKFSCEDDPSPGKFELVVGFGSEKRGQFSVHFQRCDKGATVKFFRFSLIDHEGRLLRALKSVTVTKLKTDLQWGYNDALPLDSITGRKMTILCQLKYVPDNTIPKDTCTLQIQLDYVGMLESAAFADVTFVVQEQEMAAHKNVLASRSSYFENMFQAGMQESATNRVEITDVEPGTFKSILRFLYGGVMVDEDFESLADLIAAADKYGLDELKKRCESTIRANLQVDNVIDALLLADAHNCASLLHDAKVLFKALAELLKKDQARWNKLLERPSLLLQLVDCLTD